MKLPNVMLHFSDLRRNIIVDKQFKLNNYIKDFDFKKLYSTVTCKIADLGFARKLQEDQLAETGCGTPLLMAPEILEGLQYSHGADVWSLGCLFYELLTGKLPFSANNLEELRENLRLGEYDMPKTVKLSLEGTGFLNSMLMYDPEERISWDDLYTH